jgi:hypothetical protein
MTSSVTNASVPADATQLTFSNLVVGRTYRISGLLWVGKGGATTTRNLQIELRDASSGGGNAYVIYNATEEGLSSSSIAQYVITPALVFVATSTAIYTRVSSLGGSGWFLYGHASDARRSQLTLEEINNSQEVTDFS